MTNQEFLEEALKFEGCPRDFREKYAYFCKYQAVAIEMFREFVRVCEKNGIAYVLSSGTLLGAVRDGGQIPWDYDVDVVVPYYEKEKLYRVLDQDLDEKYYFCAPERDKHYRPSMVRIVPKGYKHQMLHVDVFFLIGLPADQAERDAYCAKVRELVRARTYVTEKLSEYPYPLKTKIHKTLQKYQYLLKYGKAAIADHSAVFGRYDVRQVPFAAAITTQCGKRAIPSERYLDTIQYSTANGQVRIPRDYVRYLEDKYGDWQKYLPVEKRIAEVEKNYKRFRWYEEKGIAR